MRHPFNWLAVIIFGLSFLVVGLAALPLFHAGLFPTIDNISVVRIEAMAAELRPFYFPVRYVQSLAHGHGYLLFNYYGPLPFYVASLLYLIGINLVGALKRTFLLGLLVGAGGIFGLSREFFGPVAAFLSLSAYVFAPFLGFDLFWRGGLGEIWAMGFFPWLLWLSYRSLRRKSYWQAAMAGLTLAALLISHNLTAFISVFFFIFWLLFWLKHFRSGLKTTLLILFWGVGLAAFFILPSFLEQNSLWVKYLQTDSANFFPQLLRDNWRGVFFPTFIPMINNWTALILPFAGAFIIWKRRTLFSSSVVTVIKFAALALAFIFFMLTVLSQPLWQFFYPFLYILQFPWRFLTVAVTFGSLLTGGIVFLNRKLALPLAIVTAVVIITVNWSNFRPRTYEFIPHYQAQDPCGTTWGFEYLPTAVRTCLKTAWEKPYRLTSGRAKILSFSESPRQLIFEIEAETAINLQTNRYAYPSWKGKINGISGADLKSNNDFNLLEIELPGGRQTLELSFEDTPLRQLANIISLLTATTWLLFVFKLIVDLLKKRQIFRRYGKILRR